MTAGSSPAAPAEYNDMIKKISNFIKEVKVEMSKVSWSDKNEIIGSTVVVLVSTALLAIFIGLADFVVATAVKYLLR